MEHRLEQEVAQLLFQANGIPFVDSVEQLVGLIQKVTAKARVRLGPVPGTTVGPPKAGHHSNQIEKAGTLLARGHRSGRDVRKRVRRSSKVVSHSAILRT